MLAQYCFRAVFVHQLLRRVSEGGGTFESLVFCIGVGIKKEANNDCLLQCGGAFVWTVRTLEKLGTCRGKRMRFLLQMMEFFYSISMGRDAIWDAIPFSQYLGVLGGE